MDGDTVAIDIMKRANTDMDRGAEESSRDSRPGDYSVSRGIRCLFRRRNTKTDLYGVVIPKDRKLNQFKVYAAAEEFVQLTEVLC